MRPTCQRAGAGSAGERGTSLRTVCALARSELAGRARPRLPFGAWPARSAGDPRSRSAAALGLSAGAAEASPEDVLGFGARSSALGRDRGRRAPRATRRSTGTRRSSRWRAAAQLTLGLDQRGLRPPRRPRASRTSRSTAASSAPSSRVPFGGVLKDRIALGLGFFTPFDLVVRGRILYPERLQFPLADRTQSVAVQAGDRRRPRPRHPHRRRLRGPRGALRHGARRHRRLRPHRHHRRRHARRELRPDPRRELRPRRRLARRRSPSAASSWAASTSSSTSRISAIIVVPPLNISGVAQYDPLADRARGRAREGPVARRGRR